MYHIKDVTIDGFWGNLSIKTPLSNDVNIFIGKNGSGKTTLINILQAVLTVDLDLLENLPFESVTLNLAQKNKTRKIQVSRMKDGGPFSWIRYKVGKEPFEIPITPKEYYRRRHMLEVDMLNDLKSTMSELVDICWLSVFREILESDIKDEYRRKARPITNPIDQRLKELMKDFTRYQLTLESKAADISKSFQTDVLTSMLYDENLDDVDIKKYLKFELKDEKDKLVEAYSRLNVPEDIARVKIQKHVQKLTKSLKNLREQSKERKGFQFGDIIPLPLFQRTKYMIKLSMKAEQEKDLIFEPINQYLKIVRDFIKDKKFSLSKSGELEIKKDGTQLSIEQLSSGEKQLLIFFTETLLQQNAPFIFIADEPELSLHIEWQEKLIPTILNLNENAQIIMATHSPEIVVGYKDRLIDMEDIIYARPSSSR